MHYKVFVNSQKFDIKFENDEELEPLSKLDKILKDNEKNSDSVKMKIIDDYFKYESEKLTFLENMTDKKNKNYLIYFTFIFIFILGAYLLVKIFG